jgi:thiamine-phosphate pyrophosphorylase
MSARTHVQPPLFHLPRLYAVVDPSCFSNSEAMFAAAENFLSAGVTLLQYRNKLGSARHMLADARELKRLVGDRAKLIMNDRADLCLAAGFDGLHLGQDDLFPEAARRIIGYGGPQGLKPLSKQPRVGTAEAVPFPDVLSAAGAQKPRWLGLSTHNPEQLAMADKTSADYLAIGPVFATNSKANPDPVVGLEGVRRARQSTRKPLVAIGGITRADARSVIEAGADAVAVISDLLPDPRKSAEEFLAILR